MLSPSCLSPALSSIRIDPSVEGRRKHLDLDGLHTLTKSYGKTTLSCVGLHTVELSQLFFDTIDPASLKLSLCFSPQLMWDGSDN